MCSKNMYKMFGWSLQNSIKKAYKNYFIKNMFQTQFFSESRITKPVWFIIKYLIMFVANTKATAKQTQS
jgi:hypothetical protein